MQTPVDTRTSHVGDVIEALLVEPVRNGGSMLLPIGTRLTGRVTAVSAENKHQQTHALLQVSFDELVLPDGRALKTQASMQSLGLNEKVDADGTATIHPLSHDFALKTGRTLWLRINLPSPTGAAASVTPSNPATTTIENVPHPNSRDDPKALSALLGDLLIALYEIEDPAVRPQYGTEADRHEVLITGTVKNVGKKPVCAVIQSSLETSFKLDEPVTITFAGHNSGVIRELLPTEQLDAWFTSSVKNGTDPLKLRISQSEPEQGCGDNSHHIFKTDVGIPLASVPRVTELSPGSNGGDKPNEVLRLGAGVSPPRVLHHVEPEFSKEARKHHQEGKVVIRATVGTDGRIHDPHVIQSLGWGLDEKALEAVNQWVFDPAVKDDRKVAVYVDIEVNFRLR